jgi:hypothetical protein
MNHWLVDFFYQILSIFLFAVALLAVAYFLTEKRQTGFLISAFCAWVFMGAALCFYLSDRVLIEPETGGLLVPARLPNPPVPVSCHAPIPENALRVYLGDSLGYFVGPQITVVRVVGQSLLSIEKKDKGMSINAKIYSHDRRIVAEISDNRFQINPNNYFRRERPNKHALVIYDQEGTEVLNVDYLNPNTVQITGRFLYPSRAPVIIEATSLRIGGNIFQQACFENVQTLINIS